MTGKHRLDPRNRQHVARWILFLEGDLPYEWPVVPVVIRFALLPVHLITFGLSVRLVQTYARRGGPFDVWPFRRRSDYESALRQPPYLTGSQ